MRTASKELVGLQPDLIHVTTALATAEVLRQTGNNSSRVQCGQRPRSIGLLLRTYFVSRVAMLRVSPISSRNWGPKWLELLKELAPHISRATMLFNPVPGPQFEQRLVQLRSAGASLGIAVEAAPVRDIAEIERTIEAAGRDSQAGIVVIPDPFFNLARGGLISSLASRHHVVAVYPSRDFVIAGGLVSYSVDVPPLCNAVRQVTPIVSFERCDAIQPSGGSTKQIRACHQSQGCKKMIDLTVSPTLLARADEVIQLVDQI